MLMRRVATVLVGSLIGFFTVSQPAGAVDIFVMTNDTSDLSGTSTTFGKINPLTGKFTQIAVLSEAAGNLAFRESLPGYLYYTSGTGVDTELKRLAYAGDEVTSIGSVGRTIMGMTHNSVDDLFYSWEQSIPFDRYGTISPSNAAWSTLTNDPLSSNTIVPTGGRLAMHEGVIYGAFNDSGVGAFGTIGTAAESSFQFVTTSADFQNMVLVSAEGTLYGIFGNGVADSQQLYSINPANGARTFLTNITGAGLGTYFHGAVIPEPSTYVLCTIAAGLAGVIARRKTKPTA